MSKLSDVVVPSEGNSGDAFEDTTDYCACDLQSDEEERASARCKSCGKPIFDFLEDTGVPMARTYHTAGPWRYSVNVGPTKALIVEEDGSTIFEVLNSAHSSNFEANVRHFVACVNKNASL